ncbi:MAG: ABC transporter ATP-binding protein/permease [Legionella sp.]|nr:ABC transporter ATP-binding protein/permease [Legionella sp.]
MTYKLAKEYFISSKERYSALLLLLGVIVSVVGLVAIMALFASWSVGFWAAMNAMDTVLFMSSIQTFVLLTASYIGVSVAKDYLLGVLTINWRNWLTTRLINKYTASEGNNYLDLSRHASELENPAQRIQEDVNAYVKQALSLSINLFQSLLTFATFIGKLWIIGGSATILSITIPGYLVWVALIYSGLATLLTHLIGRALSKLTNNQQNLEAGFRSELEHLSTDAESIAQERGETYYQESLNNRFNSINDNSFKILGVKIRLTAFNAFYQQISTIIPYILAAPLYFSGAINIGQLMEVGFSFSQIQSSLSWLSMSYKDIVRFRTSAARIVALENSMNDNSHSTTAKNINVRHTESSNVSVQHLNVAYPSSTNYMMKELNLTFKPGENTLIKGRSGLGKSTLFKAIAGTWEYGDGEVLISSNKRMCFLPQRPSLPNDTLKSVLAYPDSVNTYTDEQYESVLEDVGDLDAFIDKLDTKADWSKRLSLGQQQRVSFARALLKKPDWLFLDEATASLDEESEKKMYRLVKNKLRNTTFVSIAHRSTVTRFHDRVVTLNADKGGDINLDDEIRLAENMELGNF